MVLVLIPVAVGLITVAAALLAIIWMWGVAIVETISPPAKLKPSAPSIPGFYVPRWGAYRRRKEAEEKAYWEECFNRAVPK